MFGCNPLGSSLGRIVHHGQGAVVDMGYDLIPEREESIFMGFFVFVNVNRRDFKGTVPLSADFVVCHSFIILLDVDHQHVEME
jgi:hypothetical protein